MHNRLNNDTHISPSAGTLSLRDTRQRYLGNQTQSEGWMVSHPQCLGLRVELAHSTILKTSPGCQNCNLLL